jgi:hypothetical protein
MVLEPIWFEMYQDWNSFILLVIGQSEILTFRLNMELDLESLFGHLWTTVLIGCDPATPPSPPHLGS